MLCHQLAPEVSDQMGLEDVAVGVRPAAEEAGRN